MNLNALIDNPKEMTREDVRDIPGAEFGPKAPIPKMKKSTAVKNVNARKQMPEMRIRDAKRSEKKIHEI
jgi:hypothetical protein